LYFDDKDFTAKTQEQLGLLKNAHLLCFVANRTTQRISIYTSRFGFLRALHLNIFEQPQIILLILSGSWGNLVLDKL